jgi:hypothetical protein
MKKLHVLTKREIWMLRLDKVLAKIETFLGILAAFTVGAGAGFICAILLKIS